MSAILLRMMRPGFKLFGELVKTHGPKKGAQLFKQRVMGSTPKYARKSVKKELLNPQSYKRYKKTADLKNNIDGDWFKDQLAHSNAKIRNLQKGNEDLIRLKRRLSRNLNRRPKDHQVVYREEIDMLKKKINSLNTRIGHNKNVRKNAQADLDRFNQEP